jgi:putative aldouronate transport system permease protein
MTVMGAYPLSRKDFVGRNVLTFFYTFTMFFSGGLIPFFLVCRTLGLMNNLWVMIIPGAISVYNMIITRTYFQSRIPKDLEEAAMIDGCTNFRLLIKIVLPLSAPIMAVMMLFYGVGNWNSYLQALIFINDRNLFPLQLVLREILIKNEMASMLKIVTDEQYSERIVSQMGLKYVIVIIATLPIFILYPFLQRFFKEGIMVGALKG